MAKPLNFKQKMLRFTKKHKKRATIQSVVALLLVSSVLVFHEKFEYRTVAYEQDPAVVKKSEKKEEGLLLTASMVGDMMFGRYTEEVVSRKGYDALFDYVRPYFEDSDYVTGNFEQPVVQEPPTEDMAWDKTYTYHTYPDAVKALENANFTIVNGANDHIMDYGYEAMAETVQTFKDSSVRLVGAGNNMDQATKIRYKRIKGIRIATIGITSTFPIGSQADKQYGGVFDDDPAVYVPVIREAKKKADLVFVHMHFGEEEVGKATEKQRIVAKNLAQAGADIIIGHNSHVLNQFEVIGDTLVMYGLGNFVFDQGMSKNKDSVIAQYKLYEDGRAKLEFIPVRIDGAVPKPLDGSPLRAYHRNRIFQTISNDYTGTNKRIENNRLIFEFDHSRVLEGKGM